MQPYDLGAIGSVTRTPSKITSDLDRRKLRLTSVVSLATTGAAPLTVIGAGATTAWVVSGVLGIPIAYGAVAIMLVVFSVGYTQMARFVPRGAFYAFIAQGLGRVPGLGAAWVAVLAYNAMQVGLYGGLGVVTADYLKTSWHVNVHWGLLAGAGWLVITLLGLTRIKIVGQILNVLLYGEIIIALIFAVVMSMHPAGGRIEFGTLNPVNLFTAGAGAALVTAVTGYVGFEATAVYTPEARQADRTIPRATFITLGGVGLLYTFCSFAMAVAAGSRNLIQMATDNSSELIFVLAGGHLPGVFSHVGHILFCTSLFAAALAFHTTSARYHYTLGRERILPRFMARTGQHSNAPIWGSLTQSAIGITVIVLFVVTGWDPLINLFFWITVLGGLGVLVLMVAASLAVVCYFARHKAVSAQVNLWQRVIAPTLSFLLLGWVLWQTIAQYNVLLGVDAHDKVRWILPALYAVAAIVGVIWALILRSARPDVYDGIGHAGRRPGDEIAEPVGTLTQAGGAA
ncbi:APC family permease [Dactylosporangium darangshiense]|uniref:APC family permease n=1 Tax=Dactylosporangium darangshiense TaxID=579108 RepID=A0ABP8DWM2_9ACTN